MLESALLLLAFSALGVYQMAPSVTFGDCGELCAAGATLGVPHAPGYPRYVLLAKALGTAFPFGNWAYRTNLLSAVCAAAALAVLADALRRQGLARLPRLGAVLLLGLSPVWRHNGAVTEVFALNSLLLCALFWLCSRYARRLWQPRPAAALGLAMGLGLGNHHTMILAAAPVAWAAWRARAKAHERRRAAALAAAFFLAGLSCYAFLPLRSAAHPPLDWGHPATWDAFWRVLLRKDYGSLSLGVEGAAAGGRWAAAVPQLTRWLALSWRELGPWTLLVPLGLAAWPGLGLTLPAGFAASWVVALGPFFALLGNPPLDPQVGSTLERFVAASGIGGAALAAAALERLWRGRGQGRAAAVAILAAACVWAAASWTPLRGDWASYDYGRAILRTLPPRASLFIDGGDDTFYSLAFLQEAQALRPDVDLHDRGGLVFPSAYGPDFRALPAPAKEERRRAIERIVAARGALFYSSLSRDLLPGYELRPAGLLRRVRPVAAEPSEAELETPWEFYSERWNAALLEASYRDRAVAALYPIMRSDALAREGHWDQSLTQLRLAQAVGGDALWVPPQEAYRAGLLGVGAFQSGRLDSARLAFEWQAELSPRDEGALCNLGVVAEALRQPEQALKWYQLALRVDPGSRRALSALGRLARVLPAASDELKRFR